MSRALSIRRRATASLVGLAATTLLLASPVFAAGPGHTGIVASVPSDKTPDIQDGLVNSLYDAGAKIIAGGTFTQVTNRGSATVISRPNVLAFNQATGQVDTAFAPVVDGEVRTVLAGPTADTVFIAGAFNTVNGLTRRKIALLNVNTGAVVTTFKPPAFNSRINDVVRAGNRLLVGGPFTVVGGQPRLGLVSLNVTTGKFDSYLTTSVTEHHNWAGTGAKSPVGPDKLAISPDGTQLVVIGNFKKADGVLHDQVLKLNLGATAATIADWNTDRFVPACASRAFDSWVRDVQFSPDGSYFVVVTTGAPVPPTLCDTASRWEANATGANVQPTWVAYSGGDTFLSVGITEHAVYVGGHIRWMNNSSGRDAAAAGAVARPSLAALDPVNGLPLAWNPGRRPRSYGVTEIYPTPDGLWLGYDSEFMGNFQWRRERVAFLPLTGGYVPHATTVAGLPGKVYTGGVDTGSGVDALTARSYDGAAVAGPPSVVPDTLAWSATRGAFWVGGSLFYGQGSTLMRRSFDGTTLGAAVTVDPYHDPYWDTVPTDGKDGQTFVGVASSFYGEIPNVTSMFYTTGRLYYTLSGQNGLFWRWFTPDSGIVGADKFTVAGSTGFIEAGGAFLAGGTLYLVNRNTGALSTRDWNAGTPGVTATVVSGPAVDGQNWRGRAVFLAP